VVDFNLAFFQFIWECNSENIIKIGPYLPKLLQEKFGAVFLAHPVVFADTGPVLRGRRSARSGRCGHRTGRLSLSGWPLRYDHWRTGNHWLSSAELAKLVKCHSYAFPI